MKILLMIVVLGMALAIPCGVMYSQSASIKRNDQGFGFVEIGDPEEIINEFMKATGVSRKHGQVTGIPWVDEISSNEIPGSKRSVFFKVQGISRTVVWEFIIDAEGRVLEKERRE